MFITIVQPLNMWSRPWKANLSCGTFNLVRHKSIYCFYFNVNPESLPADWHTSTETTSRCYQLHWFAHQPHLDLFQVNYWQIKKVQKDSAPSPATPIKLPCSLWALKTAVRKAALCTRQTARLSLNWAVKVKAGETQNSLSTVEMWLSLRVM